MFGVDPRCNRVSSLIFSREFFRIVSTGNLKRTNPKCQVRCSITGDFAESSVEVSFSKSRSQPMLVTP